MCPSYEHFHLTPCFVYPVDAKPPVFGEGTLVLSFVNTIGPSLMSRCSDPMANTQELEADTYIATAFP